MKKDIYIIRNLVNDKVYIGQAIDAKDRWMKHCSDARRNKEKMVIHKAMRKYGIDKFYMEIIEHQVENYDEREQYWINEYNSLVPNGYNTSVGGNSIGHGIDSPSSSFDNFFDLKRCMNDIEFTDMSFEKIGKKYGCTCSVISEINRGLSHKDINKKYPLRENNRYSMDLIRQVHYSLQYELDKSMGAIAREYNIDVSQLNEINQGYIHSLPNKEYPLRSGRAFSKIKEYAESIRYDLLNSDMEQKEIARRYNVSVALVSAINKGRAYNSDSYTYPIRQNYQCTGERASKRCLTPNEVRAIEDYLLNTNVSIKNIAKEFDIPYTTIQNMNIGSVKKYRNPKLKYPLRKKSHY